MHLDAPSLMQICAVILEKDPPALRTVNPGGSSGHRVAGCAMPRKGPGASLSDRGRARRCARCLRARPRARLGRALLLRAEPRRDGEGRTRRGRARASPIGVERRGGDSIAAPPNPASSSDEMVSFRPSRPWVRWTIPAGIGAAVGLWFVLRAPSNASSVPQPQLESLASLPSATGVVTPPESPPVAPPEPVATAKPESSAVPAAPPKVVRKAGAAAPPNAKPAPPKEKPKGTAPPHPGEPGESEPDVGF